jgi:cell division protein FtsQ
METEEQLAPEIIVEDEPRHLRRQKASRVRQRKISERVRLFLVSLAAVAAAAAVVAGARFLLVSPSLRLAGPDQIAVAGNHQVAAGTVRKVFAADYGRSLLLVPLETRQRALEQIPWVERAVVRRVLPDRIAVELAERTPVAFLRQGSGMALIDAAGAIFPAPVQGNFTFPVVTGLSSAMPLADRQSRMAVFLDFMGAIEQVRPGSTRMLSEVNLGDPEDLRATLEPPEAARAMGQGPILVHFGAAGFETKFKLYLDNIAQWQAAAPVNGISSVDLRFAQQVIVTPAAPAPVSQPGTPSAAANGKP